MVLLTRLWPKNCVAQLDFTSVCAQFISMICLQNIETPRKLLLQGKVEENLQSTAMTITLRPPLKKHEQISLLMMQGPLIFDNSGNKTIIENSFDIIMQFVA